MLALVKPSEKYLKSYTEAFDEYQAMGVSTYGLTDPRACDVFEKHENYRLGRNLKPDRVPSDCYWLVDVEGSYFIGEIHIRSATALMIPCGCGVDTLAIASGMGNGERVMERKC